MGEERNWGDQGEKEKEKTSKKAVEGEWERDRQGSSERAGEGKGEEIIWVGKGIERKGRMPAGGGSSGGGSSSKSKGSFTYFSTVTVLQKHKNAQLERRDEALEILTKIAKQVATQDLVPPLGSRPCTLGTHWDEVLEILAPREFVGARPRVMNPSWTGGAHHEGEGVACRDLERVSAFEPWTARHEQE
jgi:hypothetical protein